jgi:hypothetical protein
LADKLAWYQSIREVHAISPDLTSDLSHFIPNEDSSVMIYSLQSLSGFTHLHSFRKVYQVASELAAFAIANNMKRIVLISYPGAYFNALNLFLKLQGELEQLFSGTGIPCTILSIEAIYDRENYLHSLHELFYSDTSGAYLIPRRNGRVVHAIDIINLFQLIMKVVIDKRSGKYDVFDSVFNLPVFLSEFSEGIRVKRFIPLQLYFLSLIGQYCSPNIFELFLTNSIPMFKYRTESDFAMTLDEYKSQEHRAWRSVKRSRNKISFGHMKRLIPIR